MKKIFALIAACSLSFALFGQESDFTTGNAPALFEVRNGLYVPIERIGVSIPVEGLAKAFDVRGLVKIEFRKVMRGNIVVYVFDAARLQSIEYGKPGRGGRKHVTAQKYKHRRISKQERIIWESCSMVLSEWYTHQRYEHFIVGEESAEGLWSPLFRIFPASDTQTDLAQ